MSRYDTSKLWTEQQVRDHLRESGEDDRALAVIREAYNETFGSDLMWRYPLCTDMNAGAIIIPVQEGYFWLPYDEMTKEDYEIYSPSEAYLMDAACAQTFLDDYRSYADALCEELGLICLELKESESEG